MARFHGALSPDLEDLIHRVIGCCITVHRALGPGLPERAHSRAVALELRRLEPVHTTQALTYLKITGGNAALIVNFNVALLQEGIRRVIL